MIRKFMFLLIMIFLAKNAYAYIDPGGGRIILTSVWYLIFTVMSFIWLLIIGIIKFFKDKRKIRKK